MSQLLNLAEGYVGTPYLDGEFDCADLAAKVQWDLFGRVIALPQHRRRPTGGRGQAALIRQLRGEVARPIDSPVTGCGVLLLSDPADGGDPLWHIGTVFLEHGEIWVLHNSHTLGSAALQRLDGLRQRGLRVEGFYAWVDAGDDPMAAPAASAAAAAAPETTLVVTPHPVLLDGQSSLHAALVPGETLASFLARHGVELGQQWRVTISGAQVPEAMWGRLRPKHGQVIEAGRVPQREALRLIATIAVIYLSVQFGGAVGGMLGLSGQAAQVAGAMLINTAGSLVVNKLLPPSQARQSAQSAAETTYTLSGGRNRARPFEPMALVLGEPYCVPDLAAQPYTYFAGGELFLWQTFHAGINCAAVRDLRLGATALDTYQDVTLSRAGFAADNTGLPALAASVDTVTGGLLDAPGGAGAWMLRTSSVGAISLAIDIEAQLSSLNSRGEYQQITCAIGAEYRAVGESAWLPFVGSSSTFTLANTGTKPVRVTQQRQVEPGQYEVRLRKESPNSTINTDSNAVQWATLKTYQADTADYAGQARLGLQIRANGQLNGAIDELNWQATARPMPCWDGSAWVTATDRASGLCNPGAQFLLLARGIYDDNGRLLAGLGLPDDEIEIDQLKLFMVRCASKGFEFDLFLQENLSIDELLESICAAGMASKSWHTGKLGVVWFAENQVVEHVQNMGSMKLKSFSVDYDTLDTADEIEFQYFDRERGNSWQSIRVLAPGVTAPTTTARQQLRGVSSEAHAAVLARFSMAQNVYQRKTVSFAVDLEHLNFRRGTLMAISHDLTQWGYGGRLRAATMGAGRIVTLTLDELVPSVVPVAGTGRFIALRLPGETAYRLFGVAAFAGPSRTLTLTTAWPNGVPLPGAAADNPAMDTLWIYDFKAAPGQRLRVAEVAPEGNLAGARAALVPEGPEFWDYVWTGTYTPPPNNSLLVQDLPVVSALQVTVQRLRQGDTWVIELTVTFDVSGQVGSLQLWAAPAGNVLERVGGDIRGTRASLVVQPGQAYEIEVRPFDTLGRAGTKASTTYTVAGGAPTTVQGLGLAVTPRGVVATWTAPDDLAGVDWAATVLRIGASWAAGAPLFDGKANSHNLGWLAIGTTTLWAVHRNTAGEESAPVSATVTVAAPGQPIVEGGVQGNQVVLHWQDCTTTQPLGGYVLRVGATWETGDGAGTVQGTSFARAESAAGTRRYWVAAVDMGGNEGARGFVEVTTLPSIDGALAELEAGLGDLVDEIHAAGTGLDATRALAETAADLAAAAQEIAVAGTLLAEGAAQDLSILHIEQEAAGQALLRTTLKQKSDDDAQKQALAVARTELTTSVQAVDGRVTAEAAQRSALAVQVASDIATARNDLTTSIETVDGRVTAEGAERVALAAQVADDIASARNDLTSSIEAVDGRVTAEVANRTALAARVGDFVAGASNELSVQVIERDGIAQTLMRTSLKQAFDDQKQARAVVAAESRLSTQIGRVDGRLTSTAGNLTQLAAEVGDFRASATEQIDVLADETGYMRAQYVLALTAGGKVAGFKVNNETGSPSTFLILAEKFAVALDDADDGVFAFVVGLINGTPGVGINGNLFIDGSVLARHISVESLSAISADIGEITAGKISNVAGTSFFDLNAAGGDLALKIGDALRVKADGSEAVLKGKFTADSIAAVNTINLAGQSVSLVDGDTVVGRNNIQRSMTLTPADIPEGEATVPVVVTGCWHMSSAYAFGIGANTTGSFAGEVANLFKANPSSPGVYSFQIKTDVGPGTHFFRVGWTDAAGTFDDDFTTVRPDQLNLSIVVQIAKR